MLPAARGEWDSKNKEQLDVKINKTKQYFRSSQSLEP
jgi:hypothetical protein